MRKILLFTAAFILAIVSMPLVFGLLTEHRIHTAIDQANLPEGMIVEIKSYDRGYLSSHALLNITMMAQPAAPTLAPNQMLSFNVEGDIQHGPFFKVGDSGYHSGMAHIHAYIKAEDLAMANAEIAKNISNIFAAQEIVSADAILDLLGAFNIHIHSGSANFQSNGNSITWGGIEGHISVSADNNAIQSSFDISPMLLHSSTTLTSIDFSKMDIKSEAKRDSGMPWVGEQSLSIPAFYMRNDKGEELSFSNLIMNAASNIQDKLANAHLDAKADNMQVLSQLIKDTQLRVAVDKLDAKSFMEFSKLTQNNLNTLTAEQGQALRRSMIAMLSPGALIEFQHDMNIEQGPVNTKITIQFPVLPKADEKEAPEVTTQKLFSGITASLSMQAPTDWLETSLYKMAASNIPADALPRVDPVTNAKISAQTALQHDISNQLKALHQAGVLVNNGTQSAFQLNYENSVVALNGIKLSQEDIIKIISMFSK